MLLHFSITLMNRLNEMSHLFSKCKIPFYFGIIGAGFRLYESNK